MTTQAARTTSTDTTGQVTVPVGADSPGAGASVATRNRLTTDEGKISVAQGVGVEVGETQAAVDLDIVVEYGVSIADLGRSIQRNVKNSIERMTGLEVVEVNINVDDVHMPESGEQPSEARVS